MPLRPPPDDLFNPERPTTGVGRFPTRETSPIPTLTGAVRDPVSSGPSSRATSSRVTTVTRVGSRPSSRGIQSAASGSRPSTRQQTLGGSSRPTTGYDSNGSRPTTGYNSRHSRPTTGNNSDRLGTAERKSIGTLKYKVVGVQKTAMQMAKELISDNIRKNQTGDDQMRIPSGTNQLQPPSPSKFDSDQGGTGLGPANIGSTGHPEPESWSPVTGWRKSASPMQRQLLQTANEKALPPFIGEDRNVLYERVVDTTEAFHFGGPELRKEAVSRLTNTVGSLHIPYRSQSPDMLESTPAMVPRQSSISTNDGAKNSKRLDASVASGGGGGASTGMSGVANRTSSSSRGMESSSSRGAGTSSSSRKTKRKPSGAKRKSKPKKPRATRRKLSTIDEGWTSSRPSSEPSTGSKSLSSPGKKRVFLLSELRPSMATPRKDDRASNIVTAVTFQEDPALLGTSSSSMDPLSTFSNIDPSSFGTHMNTTGSSFPSNRDTDLDFSMNNRITFESNFGVNPQDSGMSPTLKITSEGEEVFRGVLNSAGRNLAISPPKKSIVDTTVNSLVNGFGLKGIIAENERSPPCGAGSNKGSPASSGGPESGTNTKLMALGLSMQAENKILASTSTLGTRLRVESSPTRKAIDKAQFDGSSEEEGTKLDVMKLLASKAGKQDMTKLIETPTKNRVMINSTPGYVGGQPGARPSQQEASIDIVKTPCAVNGPNLKNLELESADDLDQLQPGAGTAQKLHDKTPKTPKKGEVLNTENELYECLSFLPNKEEMKGLDQGQVPIFMEEPGDKRHTQTPYLKHGTLRGEFAALKYVAVVQHIRSMVRDKLDESKEESSNQAQMLKLLGSRQMLLDNGEIYLLWCAACALEYLGIPQRPILLFSRAIKMALEDVRVTPWIRHYIPGDFKKFTAKMVDNVLFNTTIDDDEPVAKRPFGDGKRVDTPPDLKKLSPKQKEMKERKEKKQSRAAFRKTEELAKVWLDVGGKFTIGDRFDMISKLDNSQIRRCAEDLYHSRHQMMNIARNQKTEFLKANAKTRMTELYDLFEVDCAEIEIWRTEPKNLNKLARFAKPFNPSVQKADDLYKLAQKQRNTNPFKRTKDDTSDEDLATLRPEMQYPVAAVIRKHSKEAYHRSQPEMPKDPNARREKDLPDVPFRSSKIVTRFCCSKTQEELVTESMAVRRDAVAKTNAEEKEQYQREMAEKKQKAEAEFRFMRMISAFNRHWPPLMDGEEYSDRYISDSEAEGKHGGGDDGHGLTISVSVERRAGSKTVDLGKSSSKTPDLGKSSSKTPDLGKSSSKTPDRGKSSSKTPDLGKSSSKTPGDSPKTNYGKLDASEPGDAKLADKSQAKAGGKTSWKAAKSGEITEGGSEEITNEKTIKNQPERERELYARDFKAPKFHLTNKKKALLYHVSLLFYNRAICYHQAQNRLKSFKDIDRACDLCKSAGLRVPWDYIVLRGIVAGQKFDQSKKYVDFQWALQLTLQNEQRVADTEHRLINKDGSWASGIMGATNDLARLQDELKMYEYISPIKKQTSGGAVSPMKKAKAVMATGGVGSSPSATGDGKEPRAASKGGDGESASPPQQDGMGKSLTSGGGGEGGRSSKFAKAFATPLTLEDVRQVDHMEVDKSILPRSDVGVFRIQKTVQAGGGLAKYSKQLVDMPSAETATGPFHHYLTACLNKDTGQTTDSIEIAMKYLLRHSHFFGYRDKSALHKLANRSTTRIVNAGQVLLPVPYFYFVLHGMFNLLRFRPPVCYNVSYWADHQEVPGDNESGGKSAANPQDQDEPQKSPKRSASPSRGKKKRFADLFPCGLDFDFLQKVYPADPEDSDQGMEDPRVGKRKQVAQDEGFVSPSAQKRAAQKQALVDRNSFGIGNWMIDERFLAKEIKQHKALEVFPGNTEFGEYWLVASEESNLELLVVPIRAYERCMRDLKVDNGMLQEKEVALSQDLATSGIGQDRDPCSSGKDLRGSDTGLEGSKRSLSEKGPIRSSGLRATQVDVRATHGALLKGVNDGHDIVESSSVVSKSPRGGGLDCKSIALGQDGKSTMLGGGMGMDSQSPGRSIIFQDQEEEEEEELDEYESTRNAALRDLDELFGMKDGSKKVLFPDKSGRLTPAAAQKKRKSFVKQEMAHKKQTMQGELKEQLMGARKVFSAPRGPAAHISGLKIASLHPTSETSEVKPDQRFRVSEAQFKITKHRDFVAEKKLSEPKRQVGLGKMETTPSLTGKTRSTKSSPQKGSPSLNFSPNVEEHEFVLPKAHFDADDCSGEDYTSPGDQSGRKSEKLGGSHQPEDDEENPIKMFVAPRLSTLLKTNLERMAWTGIKEEMAVMLGQKAITHEALGMQTPCSLRNRQRFSTANSLSGSLGLDPSIRNTMRPSSIHALRVGTPTATSRPSTAPGGHIHEEAPVKGTASLLQGVQTPTYAVTQKAQKLTTVGGGRQRKSTVMIGLIPKDDLNNGEDDTQRGAKEDLQISKAMSGSPQSVSQVKFDGSKLDGPKLEASRAKAGTVGTADTRSSAKKGKQPLSLSEMVKKTKRNAARSVVVRDVERRKFTRSRSPERPWDAFKEPTKAEKRAKLEKTRKEEAENLSRIKSTVSPGLRHDPLIDSAEPVDLFSGGGGGGDVTSLTASSAAAAELQARNIEFLSNLTLFKPLSSDCPVEYALHFKSMCTSMFNEVIEKHKCKIGDILYDSGVVGGLRKFRDGMIIVRSGTLLCEMYDGDELLQDPTDIQLHDIYSEDALKESLNDYSSDLAGGSAAGGSRGRSGSAFGSPDGRRASLTVTSFRTSYIKTDRGIYKIGADLSDKHSMKRADSMAVRAEIMAMNSPEGASVGQDHHGRGGRQTTNYGDSPPGRQTVSFGQGMGRPTIAPGGALTRGGTRRLSSMPGGVSHMKSRSTLCVGHGQSVFDHGGHGSVSSGIDSDMRRASNLVADAEGTNSKGVPVPLPEGLQLFAKASEAATKCVLNETEFLKQKKQMVSMYAAEQQMLAQAQGQQSPEKGRTKKGGEDEKINDSPKERRSTQGEEIRLMATKLDAESVNVEIPAKMFSANFTQVVTSSKRDLKNFLGTVIKQQKAEAGGDESDDNENVTVTKPSAQTLTMAPPTPGAKGSPSSPSSGAGPPSSPSGAGLLTIPEFPDSPTASGNGVAAMKKFKNVAKTAGLLSALGVHSDKDESKPKKNSFLTVVSEAVQQAKEEKQKIQDLLNYEYRHPDSIGDSFSRSHPGILFSPRQNRVSIEEVMREHAKEKIALKVAANNENSSKNLSLIQRASIKPGMSLSDSLAMGEFTAALDVELDPPSLPSRNSSRLSRKSTGSLNLPSDSEEGQRKSTAALNAGVQKSNTVGRKPSILLPSLKEDDVSNPMASDRKASAGGSSGGPGSPSAGTPTNQRSLNKKNSRGSCSFSPDAMVKEVSMVVQKRQSGSWDDDMFEAAQTEVPPSFRDLGARPYPFSFELSNPNTLRLANLGHDGIGQDGVYHPDSIHISNKNVKYMDDENEKDRRTLAVAPHCRDSNIRAIWSPRTTLSKYVFSNRGSVYSKLLKQAAKQTKRVLKNYVPLFTVQAGEVICREDYHEKMISDGLVQRDPAFVVKEKPPEINKKTGSQKLKDAAKAVSTKTSPVTSPEQKKQAFMDQFSPNINREKGAGFAIASNASPDGRRKCNVQSPKKKKKEKKKEPEEGKKVFCATGKDKGDYDCRRCRVTVNSTNAEIWIIPFERYGDALFTGFLKFLDHLGDNDAQLFEIDKALSWRKFRRTCVRASKNKYTPQSVWCFQQY